MIPTHLHPNPLALGVPGNWNVSAYDSELEVLMFAMCQIVAFVNGLDSYSNSTRAKRLLNVEAPFALGKANELSPYQYRLCYLSDQVPIKYPQS
jgi:hypothetical protein